ncbi:hypothetical protein ACFFWE_25455 [Sphaerisporangium melleum]|uniref:hypothetical protein n=1 Tax=Sphaerisporangium melleum TaxID=321316 RepID=UPI001668602C|nr:hypothetical protein [Sphaerisporangium melleum]
MRDRSRWPPAGRVLAAVTVMPVLALTGWLLAGLPLLLAGWFRPLPALLLGGALALALCLYGTGSRAVRPYRTAGTGDGPREGAAGPARHSGARAGETSGGRDAREAGGHGTGADRWTGVGRRWLGVLRPGTGMAWRGVGAGRPGTGAGGEVTDASVWQVVAVAVIAAASGAFNAVFRTEQLIVRRDPATYAQYTAWIARHGSLPIPYPTAAFGGPDPALQFETIGFYDHGGAVVPQFMAGAPLIDAIGYWLGGLTGLLMVPPVLGALAVLTVAGVAARLAGGRWAPPAALASAVAMPILYTSRTTFSEIPSLILIFGGMALALDARGRSRWMAALAGLAFGLAVLVRIDGLRDVLPVLAYAGLLIALRGARGRGEAYARMGPPLLGGLLVGSGLGLAAAFFLARPYLNYLSGSVRPLLAICAVVLVLTAVGAVAGPKLAPGVPRLLRTGWRARLLPGLAAALVVLVAAGFAVRPWVQTVRRVPANLDDRLNSIFIEWTQQANGLPADGERLYSEQSLYWVFWYIGVPAVALATLAAAVVTWRMARGREFRWLLPLAVIGWTTVTTLWRPAITPDHPFASRRLVPVVIPGLIVLAAWGARWAWAKMRDAGYGPPVLRVAVAGSVVLLVVPAVVTSIGTAFTPVERGEAAAVRGLCAALPRDASVLMVERVTGDRFTQVVRAMCDRPAAVVRRPGGADATPGDGTGAGTGAADGSSAGTGAGRDVAAASDVLRLAGRIRAAGRVPVLLAAERLQLLRYGTPTQVVRLRTRQDERSLVDPPNGTWSLSIDVWMVVPATG